MLRERHCKWFSSRISSSEIPWCVSLSIGHVHDREVTGVAEPTCAMQYSVSTDARSSSSPVDGGFSLASSAFSVSVMIGHERRNKPLCFLTASRGKDADI